jgi:NADH dehydrogenase/NADH:ubiquinone oxidoreductase subunit G
LSLNFLKELHSWIILGSSVSERLNKADIFFFLKKLFPKINFLNLKRSSNSESLLFLNIKFINTNLLKKAPNLFAWCLEDNLFVHKILYSFQKTKYWINSHAPHLARKSNYLIPTLTCFETDGIFINFEGKSQKAFKSILNSNKNIINLDFFFSFFINYYSFKQQRLKSPFFFL